LIPQSDDIRCSSASVIGLYTSYATPIFLRITSGRDTFVPGSFTLGRWFVPIGAIAVAWVSFINILLMFPTVLPATAKNMSEFLTNFLLPLYVTPSPRLCGCHHHVSVHLCFIVMGDFCPKMVQRPYSKLGRRVVLGGERFLCRIAYMTRVAFPSRNNDTQLA
jgi:hypothetical protein